jgi:hypothetical protein
MFSNDTYVKGAKTGLTSAPKPQWQGSELQSAWYQTHSTCGLKDWGCGRLVARLGNLTPQLSGGNSALLNSPSNGRRLRLPGQPSRSKAMRFILAWARTFPPSESCGWIIHFIERTSRYWVYAQAGQKMNQLFEQGTLQAWE